MNIIRSFIKKILLEEIGRNYHTIDDSPHTFRSFQGYDIQIDPMADSKYRLSVEFKGKKIGDSRIFKDYEEADHAARTIIDSHRVKFMNQ